MKKFIWQIKQFFRPFPDKESWAYAFYGWLYDLKLKKTKTSSSKQEKPGPNKPEGFTFPTTLNSFTFRAVATIYDPSLEDIAISLTKRGVTAEEATRAISEFARTIQIIIKELDDAKNPDEILPTDVINTDKLSGYISTISTGEIKENKSEEKNIPPIVFRHDPDTAPRIPVKFDRYSEDAHIGVDAGQGDFSAAPVFPGDTRSPTLPSDRIVEYMMAPGELFEGNMYRVLDQVKKEISYDRWCVLDTIIVRTSTGHLIGHIDPKRQTFTSSEPFAEGDGP